MAKTTHQLPRKRKPRTLLIQAKVNRDELMQIRRNAKAFGSISALIRAQLLTQRSK